MRQGVFFAIQLSHCNKESTRSLADKPQSLFSLQVNLVKEWTSFAVVNSLLFNLANAIIFNRY